MNRCVIIGGAEIGNYGQIRRCLREDDFFICCDSGLKHAPGLGISPSLIVGDFDSCERPDTDVETIVLPREKDDTDTVYAAKEAVRRGFGEFLLIGVIGARFDHTFGNVALLLWLDSMGRKAQIRDNYSEMEIVSGKPAEIEDRYPFFSLLNIDGTARKITICGAKYPLEDGEIRSDYQYGISNEVTPGGKATVSVGEGRVLLVKVISSQQPVIRG